MSPTLNKEMLVALDEIERDGVSEVLVLTGAGDAFSAGMDLKEYFREVDGKPAHVQSDGGGDPGPDRPQPSGHRWGTAES
jgi:enoyl-CoA hydratase/carnithine racemase